MLQELSHQELMKLKAEKRKKNQQNQKVFRRKLKHTKTMNGHVCTQKRKCRLTLFNLDLYLECKMLMSKGNLYKREENALVQADLAKIVVQQICHNVEKTNPEPNCVISVR